MIRKLGDFSVVGIGDSKLPGHQVDLGVAWVGTRFYKQHEVSRDSFVEITYRGGKKPVSIVRLLRCVPGSNIRNDAIGLQYDCQLQLGAKDGELVEAYFVPRLRGMLIYLASHPSPLIRFQFWLTVILAFLGIFFSGISAFL